MISEYALDPALVAGWHDLKEWALYREAFADGRGRYGSMFPRQNGKKWRQYVFHRFRELFPEATPESQSWLRLDALLKQLSERMVERIASDARAVPWLEKVVEEHRARPFHGILSTQPAAGVPEVITPDMLFGEHQPSAWKAPQSSVIARNALAFAQALAPLLTRCKEAVFVDPYFDPKEQRFRNSLAAMLQVLWGPSCCVSPPKCQLVVAEPPRGADGLLKDCQQRLPQILPNGRSLRVTVLRKREGGEKIHNRYVLTLLAAVMFGTGLDVSHEGKTDESDDLCRLSGEQLDKRWGQYVTAPSSYFEIAAGPKDISSIRETVSAPRVTGL